MASTAVFALITSSSFAVGEPLMSCLLPSIPVAVFPNTPSRVLIKIAWNLRAQYAATRSPIAAMGSSPDNAFAKSFTLHARPRVRSAATSCPASILPTVRAVLSLSTSSSPVRSSQNGIFTSLPPELANTSSAGVLAMIPLW